MIDWSIAKQLAFAEIEKTHAIHRMDSLERAALSYAEEEVWVVQSEILDRDSKLVELVYHMGIPIDFPLTLPNLYVSPTHYASLQYMPHVSPSRLICAYDPEVVRSDPNRPGEIVRTLLTKARQVIESGLSETTPPPTEPEFMAHWSFDYGSGEEVKKALSLLPTELQIGSIDVLQLEQKAAQFSCVLCVQDEPSQHFKQFLSLNQIPFAISTALYIGLIKINLRPPYAMTNRQVVEEVISKLDQQVKTMFWQFIEGTTNFKKIVLAHVDAGDARHLIGWSHSELVREHDGFRKVKAPLAMRTFNADDMVTRIVLQSVSPNRLIQRTIGNQDHGRLSPKFLVAGVGSLGSNLTHLLAAIPQAEFTLVDPDGLSLENIGRHFLGFRYNGCYKVLAMKHYLLNHNPTRFVEARNESIVSLCRSEPNKVNWANYIFAATGKTNIDRWLADAMDTKMITKPIFFLWVEPYLSGGHCLFLHPGDGRYNDFFDDDQLFKRNVIHPDEYHNGNQLFTLREAGCQTTFMPFSGLDMTEFLAAILPSILRVIETGDTKSFALTWTGNLDRLHRMSIKISEFGESSSSKTLSSFSP